MNDHASKNDDALIVTDLPSPGESQIEKAKARPRSAFHFGLMTLFLLMIGTSLLLAMLRGMGVDYIDFLGLSLLLIYGCAPLVCWTAFMILPAKFGSWRWLVAAIIGALIVLPPWILSAMDGHFLEIVGGSLYFWVPQSACIAAVQYFAFSKRRTRSFWR